MGWDEKIGILLDFVEDLRFWTGLDFLVGVWINQLYPELKNRTLALVFVTPIHHKTTVFLHFSVGLIIKQTFDKIRSGLSERNKLERMFVL